MEKRYWIATSALEKIGPMSLEELIASPHFGPEARVWRDGLSGWVKASELPELQNCFAPAEVIVAQCAPAPAEKAESIPERPRTYLGWSIAAIILCCMIPAIVAVIYATYVNSRYSEGDYEGAREASRTAEVWLLVSIVAGIVELPFLLVFNLFQ